MCAQKHSSINAYEKLLKILVFLTDVQTFFQTVSFYGFKLYYILADIRTAIIVAGLFEGGWSNTANHLIKEARNDRLCSWMWEW